MESRYDSTCRNLACWQGWQTQKLHSMKVNGWLWACVAKEAERERKEKLALQINGVELSLAARARLKKRLKHAAVLAQAVASFLAVVRDVVAIRVWRA